MRIHAAAAAAVGFALATSGLVAVGSGGAGAGSRGVARAAEPVEITVMSQNIMYGGDDFDLDSGEYCAVTDGCPQALRRIARIIEATGADIVGVQEPERNVSRLARKLGWHASPAAHVISRFPIIEPPGADGVYVFVAVAPNRVVAVSNVHLISAPYGPDAVRDGATLNEVLRLERRTRLYDLRPQLRVLPRLAARGFPVILTGDFNTPSHLDWTQAAADARPDVVQYPVRWPVGRALDRAGFVDTYRDVHPDPVDRPGFTWTPGGPEGTAGQIMDRIDWILHSGPATTLDSQVVGETGGPDVDLGFAHPYPTDHRGVLSTVAVEPRKPPVYASAAPRPIIAGETVDVSYHLPAGRHDRIRLMKRDDHGALRTVRSIASPGDFGYHARLHIPQRFDGRYVLVVRSADRSAIVSRQPLWVYQPGERPTLRTSGDSYRFEQPIRVRWTKAPGMRLDWVGVIPCRRHGACRGNGSYLRYSYTTTRVQGRLTMGERFGPMEGDETWPIPPGEYVLRLFVDDSYVDIAQSTRFTVRRR